MSDIENLQAAAAAAEAAAAEAVQAMYAAQRAVREAEEQEAQEQAKRGALHRAEMPYGKLAIYRDGRRVQAHVNGEYVLSSRTVRTALESLDRAFQRLRPVGA